MKILLEYGCDVEAITTMKRKAVHFAVLTGELEYIDYLISVGADYNSLDIDKETPLHYASRHGYYDIVNYLLKKKAILVKNIYNETPIDVSADIKIYRVYNN